QRALAYLLPCLLVLAASSACAGALDSGAYTVRYSAVNSLQIPASVARSNGIERDGNMAVITVTLQKPTADHPYQAVAATVTGTARTLLGTPQKLAFRRVDTGNSVYSIATVPLGEAVQTVTVQLEVTTADGSALIPVEFTQKMYRRER